MGRFALRYVTLRCNATEEIKIKKHEENEFLESYSAGSEKSRRKFMGLWSSRAHLDLEYLDSLGFIEAMDHEAGNSNGGEASFGYLRQVFTIVRARTLKSLAVRYISN